MTIHFLLVVNKQSKVRLTKWYSTYTAKEKEHIVRELAHLVTTREDQLCNFIDWRDKTIVYRRYASLFFLFCTDKEDNELLSLEILHRFVSTLDKYFKNVTEIDLVYDFTRAYLMLDEMIASGELQETSTTEILRNIDAQDSLHLQELKQKEKGKSGLKVLVNNHDFYSSGTYDQ